MSPANEVVASYQLKNISPRAFQHPADRAASAALRKIPYLDRLARKLIEIGYEKVLRESYLGSSIRISETQLQDVWRDHVYAYSTLDMPDIPELYLTQFPIANAAAIGAKKPIIVVQSGLISLLDENQRRAVFAHEAAHVLSDHQLWQTALMIMLSLGNAARIPLGFLPVRTVLLEWSRAAELSCDRAAALVTQDPLAVCRTLMSISAGAMVSQLDLDAFMTQALEYVEPTGSLDRLTRLSLDMGLTHPMPVRRVHELMAWVRSGEFDRIVAGEYPKRDEEARLRDEGGQVASHYNALFRDAFDEAGAQMSTAAQQVTEWFSKRSKE
jgi:Zn-dependent protease with chaperone function